MFGKFRTTVLTLLGCFTVYGLLVLLLARDSIGGYFAQDAAAWNTWSESGDLGSVYVKSAGAESGKREAGDSQPIAFTSATAQAQKLLSADFFLGRLLSDRRSFQANVGMIERDWDLSYVPMLLEVVQFLPPLERGTIIGLLESKTNNKFGLDFDKWRPWIWKQDYQPHPEYAKFKSNLYGRIDPRFPEYFADTKGSKIRLDEIRWGGVRRDGIPPLKNPIMLEAQQATYLADSDVVFGIELNGDSRAYPKRILAWHEMFKDTIGGESVCGVY